MGKRKDILTIPCLYISAPECCPYRHRSDNPCEVTRHHLFWRRADYKTQLEHSFRELPVNSVMCCRGLHDQLECVNRYPDKPTKERMHKETGTPVEH